MIAFTCQYSVEKVNGRWQAIPAKIIYHERIVCCSCYRVDKKQSSSDGGEGEGEGEGEYIDLGDGRSVCPNCYPMAVIDSEKGKLILGQVSKFYKEKDLEIDPNIAVVLTDKYEITKYTKHWNFGTVVSNPADKTIMTIESFSLEEGKIKLAKVPRKQTNHKEPLVLLFFGYHEVVAQATLAHELMHIWLDQNGLKHHQLEKEVSEGICEVMAFMYLDWYAQDNGDKLPSFVEDLIQRHKAAMEDRDRPGYKKAKIAVSKHELKYTLDHILKTKKLPK